MSDDDLIEHFAEQIIQIITMRDNFEIRRIQFFRFFDVQAVQIRVIKEITLAAPNFVKHLFPLGSRININFHSRSFNNAFAGSRRCGCRNQIPRRALTVKHLFAVCRNAETADAGFYFFKFALFQIEFVQSQTERRILRLRNFRNVNNS